MVLVGYWPFNESSGTTAYDHSGRENHGGLNGDVSPGSKGVLSEISYSFDGSNEYVGLGGTSQLDFGKGSLTITAWFRTPENSQQVKIVNRGQSGDFPSSSGYSLRFYDKYCVAFIDGSKNSSVYVDNASKVSQNEWHLGAGEYLKEEETRRYFISIMNSLEQSMPLHSVAYPTPMQTPIYEF